MLKVLIVDHEKRHLNLCESKLDLNAMEVRRAEDGEFALKIYYGWKPDIIMLDLQLPGLSGYSVLKKIREEYSDKDVTIVMATSSTVKDDIVDCARLGIQGYMLKPIDYNMISGNILEYYAKHHPEKAANATEYKEAS